MTSTRIFIAMVLLATIMGCQSQKDNPLPANLLGVWKTSEPKYADRFFELTKDAIIFGTGGDNVDTYPIASIERTRDEEGLLYNIHYLNREGQQYTFSIYYDSTNHGVIRFKNQKHFTWTKEKR
ncbi:MAG: hypothetical protein V3U42_06750 [candidate division NC10 bacterium]|jgi:hypothetical protein|nr:hypothetical protein [candidate division NC10 bacterium]